MTSEPIGSVTSTSLRLCVRAPRTMSCEAEEVTESDMKPPVRALSGDPKPLMVPDGGEIGKGDRRRAPDYGLRTTDFGLQTSDCGLQTSDCGGRPEGLRYMRDLR